MMYPLSTMFKAIFIKSSLVFLGIFCFSLLSLAQPATTQVTGKSADVTQAAPAKPAAAAATVQSAQVNPAAATAVAPSQPSLRSGDVTTQAPEPAATPISATNQPFPPPPTVSGDPKGGQAGQLPPQHLMPAQIEERIKNSLISRMSTIDLRKLKSIKWPPLDLIKHKDADYADLDTIKDTKLLKKRLNERCVDYVQAYENYVKETYGAANVGTQFSIQCDIYSAILEDAQFSTTDPFFDVPNEGLLRRLDQITYALYTAQSNGSLVRATIVENYLKSYDSSLFGLAGIPIEFSFLASQILMIILLGLSGFLLFKVIRG